MRGRITLVAALLAVSAWACGTPTTSPTQVAAPSPAMVASPPSSPSPSPSSSPSPIPTPTAAPTPSPTPDPEAVRKAAGAAYLAAAESANKAGAALNKKYKTYGTLARARAFHKAAAKIESDFIAKLKKITVPADTASDLHSLIAKDAATQALDIEGSGVTSWADVVSVDAALLKAARASTAAANLVRSDLGLPPVHL